MRRFWLYVLGGLTLAFSGCALLVFLGIAYYSVRNSSSSVPGSVYLALPPFRRVERGDVVLVCLPRAFALEGVSRGYIGRGPCGAGSEPLLKIVAAVSGDVVDEGDEGVRIDGRRVRNSRPIRSDFEKRALQPRYGRLVIPAQSVWLMGVATRSWDSRYWGPVPESAVRALCFRRDGPQPHLQFSAGS